MLGQIADMITVKGKDGSSITLKRDPAGRAKAGAIAAQQLAAGGLSGSRVPVTGDPGTDMLLAQQDGIGLESPLALPLTATPSAPEATAPLPLGVNLSSGEPLALPGGGAVNSGAPLALPATAAAGGPGVLPLGQGSQFGMGSQGGEILPLVGSGAKDASLMGTDQILPAPESVALEQQLPPGVGSQIEEYVQQESTIPRMTTMQEMMGFWEKTNQRIMATRMQQFGGFLDAREQIRNERIDQLFNLLNTRYEERSRRLDEQLRQAQIRSFVRSAGNFALSAMDRRPVDWGEDPTNQILQEIEALDDRWEDTAIGMLQLRMQGEVDPAVYARLMTESALDPGDFLGMVPEQMTDLERRQAEANIANTEQRTRTSAQQAETGAALADRYRREATGTGVAPPNEALIDQILAGVPEEQRASVREALLQTGMRTVDPDAERSLQYLGITPPGGSADGGGAAERVDVEAAFNRLSSLDNYGRRSDRSEAAARQERANARAFSAANPDNAYGRLLAESADIADAIDATQDLSNDERQALEPAAFAMLRAGVPAERVRQFVEAVTAMSNRGRGAPRTEMFETIARAMADGMDPADIADLVLGSP